MKEAEFRALVRPVHVELLKLQRWVVETGQRVVVIFDGRDTAGKGGAMKRLAEPLDPAVCRVAPTSGMPTERERGCWYFQRFVPHLPARGEVVLFDRAWYARPGVERVTGACTAEQAAECLTAIPELERMLVRDGLRLFKLYFLVSRAEQARRLEKRQHDALDEPWRAAAVPELQPQPRWDEFARAADEMFRRTSTDQAPWLVVDADDKRRARLHAMRHLLTALDYPEKDASALAVDLKVVHPWWPAAEPP
jgi:polyphosphate kinase 2